MGTGAAMGVESAGITLVKSDHRGIVWARRLAWATLRNIRQNLFLRVLIQFHGCADCFGDPSPAFEVLLSPVIPTATMSFSSVSVIANALRLRRLKL